MILRTYIKTALLLCVLAAISCQPAKKEKSWQPTILSWKWDAELFNDSLMSVRIAEIVKRSDFNTISMYLHWVEASWFDKELIQAMKQACDELHKAGRKFVVDLDPRDEGDEFIKEFPDKRAYFGTTIEVKLDKNGDGSIILKPVKLDRWKRVRPTNADHIINAWTMDLKDKKTYNPSTVNNIREKVSIEKLDSQYVKLIVKAGKENANKTSVIIPGLPHILPDLFTEESKQFFVRMLEAVKDIPLDGASWGEWGQSPVFIFENGQLHFEHFPYSKEMAKQYKQKTGRVLEDELLMFNYTPEGKFNERFSLINNYTELLRNKMGENEEFFYAQTKKYLGQDALILDHPTFAWFYMDILYNGMHWWQAKRDYAFTDETTPVCVRLALMHKWGGKVWYNMFYSAGSLKIESYFKETWGNVRFGGRTDYLSYECKNKTIDGGVLELKEKNYFELCNDMEKKVALLDEVQTSQPDTRVAFIFGYEACTNWSLINDFQGRWSYKEPYLEYATGLADSLFKQGSYLVDLLPSSEIVNGSFKLKGNKAIYGNQTYDAVVFLYPDGSHKGVLDFLNSYIAVNKNLLLYGDCSLYNHGADATADFKAISQKIDGYSRKPASLKKITETLKKWNISQNKWENGCILQDGSAIFTAAGIIPDDEIKNIGNVFTVNTTVKGQVLNFTGEDFLFIDIDNQGNVKKYSAGKITELKVNGKSVK